VATLTKLALSVIGGLKADRVKGRGGQTVIALPPPQASGGMPLMAAFAARRSQREFAADPLPPQVLSDLLWSAFGVNRAVNRGRTAPSALGAQEIDVYAALAGGLYIYDADGHRLARVAQVDARRVTGFQDFVDEAPLDLVYVADQAHLKNVPGEHRAAYSAASAGAIAQNVYLYCASAGLATVVRGWLDRRALAATLGLGPEEHIVLAQTVGYAARPSTASH
jgi:SagB-type dehydrogenase family enzyme